MKLGRHTTLALATTLLLAATAAAQDFGYFGELGPPHWGDLDFDFSLCESGTQQSPIDLGRATLRGRSYKRLPISYGPTAGEIFDNGHTIEVETEGDNRLTLDGEEYELIQFHFHTPSEHTVRGRGSDMELHLVHRSDSGGLAVIGVLLDRGDTSGDLAAIFDLLPDNLRGRQPLDEELEPEHFLPEDRTNYRYRGSLTTPPCSEDVRWIVMAESVPVSDDHMARFTERIHFNARPVQRLTP